jgi:cytochrome c biogenesis protein CcmG/thiol:disulfide interchange protein DsbE
LKSKTLILLIIILSGAVVVFYTIRHQQSPSTIRVGLPAPDIELTDSNKNEFKLSELRGSVVFVNFWATWCPPCIEEIPSIERLSRYLAGNSTFKMVTIPYNDDMNKVLGYMKEMDYTFPVYLDSEGNAAKKFGITGVPETYIIDKKGILRNKVIGPSDWDSPYVIETLSKLINEQ